MRAQCPERVAVLAAEGPDLRSPLHEFALDPLKQARLSPVGPASGGAVRRRCQVPVDAAFGVVRHVNQRRVLYAR